MIFVDIESCKKEVYIQLIHYIFEKCNRVSFHIPNFMNLTPVDMKLNLNNYKTSDIEEYQTYLKNTQSIKELCLKHHAKIQESRYYNGTKFSYQTKIITVDLFEELKNEILKYHIFEWVYPERPEDLCFFKNDKCRFWSNAHEELFCVENEEKSDIEFLKKHALNFIIKKTQKNRM